MKVLGVDIGGSALKGAPVDTGSGRLLAEKFQIDTPEVQTPEEVAGSVAEMARHFRWRGPIGVGFPGTMIAGRVAFLGNLSQDWVGRDAAGLFAAATGRRVSVINDADAAGLAEMRFGAGRGQPGTVLLLTAGTGIGSALFRDGRLVPNLEFGHVPLHGRPAEKYAAASVRRVLGLGWPQWAGRFNEYLTLVEGLLWPDLIIIGGGVSRESARWFKHLKTRARVVPAALHNEAGIVGAALGLPRARR